MVNLEPMFKAMADEVLSGNADRYAVVNEEHVMDTSLGIEYHLYPSWKEKPFKITKDDEVVIDGTQMTQGEAAILEHVRKELCKHFTETHRKNLFDLSSAPKSTPSVIEPPAGSAVNGGY